MTKYIKKDICLPHSLLVILQKTQQKIENKNTNNTTLQLTATQSQQPP